MQFKYSDKYKKEGKRIGYFVSFLIFTFLLYFILNLFNKIPNNWNLIHFTFLSALIIIIGLTIRYILQNGA